MHLLAADALVGSCAEVESLRVRTLQREAVARLNGETIRGMQRAAAEIERAQWFRRYGVEERYEENVTPIFAPQSDTWHQVLRVKVNVLQCVAIALTKAEGDGALDDDAGAGALRALEQVVSELDRMTRDF